MAYFIVSWFNFALFVVVYFLLLLVGYVAILWSFDGVGRFASTPCFVFSAAGDLVLLVVA